MPEGTLLETFGSIAGVAGVVLFVFFVLFRDIIKRLLIESLGPARSYKILKSMITSITVVTIVGIIAWLFGGGEESNASLIIKGVIGDVNVNM